MFFNEFIQICTRNITQNTNTYFSVTTMHCTRTQESVDRKQTIKSRIHKNSSFPGRKQHRFFWFFTFCETFDDQKNTNFEEIWRLHILIVCTISGSCKSQKHKFLMCLRKIWQVFYEKWDIFGPVKECPIFGWIFSMFGWM